MILSNFTNELQEKKKEIKYLDESSIQHTDDQDEEDKGDVNNILSGIRRVVDYEENKMIQAPKLNKVILKTKGQEIVEAIENNFE